MESTPAQPPTDSPKQTEVQEKNPEFDEATAALFTAVYGNNPAGVEAAIKRGADIEERDANYRSPLHYAASREYMEVMEVLLKAGADLEGESRYGDRPLHWAAMWGKNKAVARLVEAGAQLHPVGSNGRTALKWAVDEGHPTTASLLKSLGALE